MIDTLPIGFSTPTAASSRRGSRKRSRRSIIIALFRFNRIGYKLDAVISGFAIGAGFSVVENILYLTIFPDYGAGTWLVRGLGTAVMHGTTLALLAAIAHELAERESREAAGEFNFNLLWFLPGYLIAVAIHTAFNHFPDRPLLAMMGAAIFAPSRSWRFSISAPPRRRAGSSPKLPSTGAARCAARRRLARQPSGRRISALAGRLDAEGANASAATGSCRRGSCSRPRRR